MTLSSVDATLFHVIGAWFDEVASSYKVVCFLSLGYFCIMGGEFAWEYIEALPHTWSMSVAIYIGQKNKRNRK